MLLVLNNRAQEFMEGEMEGGGWTGFQTRDFWLFSQTHYQLLYRAWLQCSIYRKHTHPK